MTECPNEGSIRFVLTAYYAQSKTCEGPAIFDLTSQEDQVLFREMFGPAVDICFRVMVHSRTNNNTYGCLSFLEDAVASNVAGALLVGAV